MQSLAKCTVLMRYTHLLLFFSSLSSLVKAMKVENMVKLKEEYDYKSLSRRLEKEIDRLVIENERQTKAMLLVVQAKSSCN